MRRLVGTAIAACAVLALVVSPAAADPVGGVGGPPPPAAPPPPVDGSSGPQQAGTNQPATAQVRTCSLYASSGTYGMTCRGATGDSASYAEILGTEPVPTCWHEDVPAGFKPPRTRDDLAPNGTWYLKTCLVSGIDPDTKQPTGRLRFSQEPDYVAPPDEPVELLPGQALIVAGVRDVRQIPAPFVQPSPSANPRTGQQLAFYVPPVNTEGPTITVTGPGIGTVQMRARQTQLTVWPLGSRPEPAVQCAGGGVQVTLDDTPATQPGACWWTFERSSASERNNRYPMQVQADWIVEYNAGGDWVQLGLFTREQQILQRIVEVQTIVVP